MKHYSEVYRLLEVRTDKNTYRIEALESGGEFEARIYVELNLDNTSDARICEKGGLLACVFGKFPLPDPITGDSAERVIEKACNLIGE